MLSHTGTWSTYIVAPRNIYIPNTDTYTDADTHTHTLATEGLNNVITIIVIIMRENKMK